MIHRTNAHIRLTLLTCLGLLGLFGLTHGKTGQILARQPYIAQPQQSLIIPNTTSWRLPFDGSMVITNGPGEGLHINSATYSIDYAPSPSQSFAVLSPADGEVIDLLEVRDALTNEYTGYGRVLRIYHSESNACSFFAHLLEGPLPIPTTPGTPVKQGQHIANSGETGNGAGYHLHFEARRNCQPGQIYSGESIPAYAMFGNWWNPNYNPPLSTMTTAYPPTTSFSGQAEFPVQAIPPALLEPDGHHLSNTASPYDSPSAYASNIQQNDTTLHMGAAPDLFDSPTEVFFDVFYYEPGQFWFYIPSGTGIVGPTWQLDFSEIAPCIPATRQFCLTVRSRLRSASSFDQSATIHLDIAPGNSLAKPHLAAYYTLMGDHTVLEYAFQTAQNVEGYILVHFYIDGQTYEPKLNYLLTEGTQTTLPRDAYGTNAYLVGAVLTSSPVAIVWSDWIFTAARLPREILQVDYRAPADIETQQIYETAQLIISGYGNAAGRQLTDAYYMFTDQSQYPLASPVIATSHRLKINGSLLPYPYPPYSSAHVYPFAYRAPAASTLEFGIGDTTWIDNGGSLWIQIWPLLERVFLPVLSLSN